MKCAPFTFLTGQITEFHQRKDETERVQPLGRKIFVLYEFGKIQDAIILSKEAEENWPNVPLNAFVLS